jgi:gliding motility-associated-like protein
MISCFGLEDGMLKATPYFGRPPYTYSWNHNPSLNNPVADNLPPGTYTVTITDANDSTAQVSHDILEPSPIGITGIVTPVSCLNGNDGAIDLSVTGGTIKSDYAYFWTTLNGSGVDPLSADQSGLSRGIYTVVVEDDNLCSDSAEFEVTQPAPFNYSGTLITQIIKPIPPGQTGSIDLHVSGGSSPYGYAWTGPDGFNATTEDIASLDTAGLYNLSLTDNKGCVSDTAFAVIDNFTFVAQIIAQTNVLCHNGNDGTATVSVFNAVKPCTYNWNDVGMLLDSVRTGMAAGNYTVIVTDAALHTALARVKITEPSADLSLILDPKDLRCYNDFSGVVDLNVAGGTLPYSFDWDNGFTGEDLVNVEAGNYNVRVTDANDCEATGNTSLSEPDPIVLDITLSGNIYCFEGNTVSATVNASGGFGTFSYLWDDPGNQITETAYDLEAGWYSVEVTDMNNCKQTASILITQPTALSVTASLYNPCPGSSDGAIIPTVTGGTPAYDYEWSNSVFERMNTDISAGTYELTVTDHNSCTLVQNFTLSDTDSVKISNVNLLQPSCANPTGGSITIEALGGTGIYEYSIDEGQHFTADSIFESLGSGSYLIIVHDEKDCASKQVSAVLEIPANCALVIYDAFSPNGDDKNPVWNIGNIESFPNCRVQIFNLWGIMVFASNGYGTPWDGTYKGKDLPSGTYYYIIDPGDGSSVITGSVNIVY